LPEFQVILKILLLSEGPQLIHFLASQSTEDLRELLKILIKSPDAVIFFDSRVEAYRHKAESFHPLTAGFTGHQVT